MALSIWQASWNGTRFLMLKYTIQNKLRVTFNFLKVFVFANGQTTVHNN